MVLGLSRKVTVHIWTVVTFIGLMMCGCTTVKPTNPLRILPFFNSKNYIPPTGQGVASSPADMYHWFAISVFTVAIIIGLFVGLTEKRLSKVAMWLGGVAGLISVWASMQETISAMVPWILGAMTIVGIGYLAFKAGIFTRNKDERSPKHKVIR